MNLSPCMLLLLMPMFMQAAEIPSLQQGFVVIAHRGNHTHAHENTMTALQKAIDAGVDYAEIDVRRTLDGHHILMHDSTVGIKRDGSLWQFHSLSPPWQKGNWLLSRTQPSQYSDWLAVCPNGNAYLTFAGDGSLCRWVDPQVDVYFYIQPDRFQLLLPSRIKARRIGSILW